MSLDRSKWEITVDYAMWIGKYLETEQDLIELSKVTKSYQNVIGMYKFNPTDDLDLYPNVETYKIYKRKDFENGYTFDNYYKKGMYKYEFWYDMNYKEVKKINHEKKWIVIDDGKGGIDIDDSSYIEFKGNVDFGVDNLNDNNSLKFEKDNDLIITIPDEVSKINNNFNDGLTPVYNYVTDKNLTIKLPNRLKEIGKNFSFNHLKDINFPNTLTKIGEGCFIDYNLENLNLPPLLTVIERGCFMNCPFIQNIKIPEGITEIQDYCFQSCPNLTNIILPNSLIEMGNVVFYDTPITIFEFPVNLDRIGVNCFKNLNIAIFHSYILIKSILKLYHVKTFIFKNGKNYINNLDLTLNPIPDELDFVLSIRDNDLIIERVIRN